MTAAIIIFANLLFLAGIYLIPKYFYKYLLGKKLKSRYRFTLIFLIIGMIQVLASAFGYAVLPAYFLFLVYFAIFAKAAAILGIMISDSTELFFWTLLFSQTIPYSFIGFLFGILHEHYGTDIKEATL